MPAHVRVGGAEHHAQKQLARGAFHQRVVSSLGRQAKTNRACLQIGQQLGVLAQSETPAGVEHQSALAQIVVGQGKALGWYDGNVEPVLSILAAAGMLLALLRLGHHVPRESHRVLFAQGFAQPRQSVIALHREGSGSAGVAGCGRWLARRRRRRDWRRQRGCLSRLGRGAGECRS